MIQHSTGTIWVGMDVHQSSITAAILHGDSPEPEVVRLPGDLNATRRLFRRLAEHGTPLACYEASGAGYVLQRTLDHDGFHCEVIAPSLIPSLPGDHRKTEANDGGGQHNPVNRDCAVFVLAEVLDEVKHVFSPN